MDYELPPMHTPVNQTPPWFQPPFASLEEGVSPAQAEESIVASNELVVEEPEEDIYGSSPYVRAVVTREESISVLPLEEPSPALAVGSVVADDSVE